MILTQLMKGLIYIVNIVIKNIKLLSIKEKIFLRNIIKIKNVIKKTKNYYLTLMMANPVILSKVIYMHMVDMNVVAMDIGMKEIVKNIIVI